MSQFRSAVRWAPLAALMFASTFAFGQDDDADPPPPATATATAEPSDAPDPTPSASAEPEASGEPSADPAPTASAVADADEPGEGDKPAAAEEPAAESTPGEEEGETFGTPEPPGADDYDIEDAAAAGYEVGEGTNDDPGGLGVNGKDYELDEKSFEGMEGLDAADLEALTEVTPAELGELDMDRDMTKEAEEQFEKQAEALQGLNPDDLSKIASMYINVVRVKLRDVQAKTYDKTVEKMREKNAKRIGTVSTILAYLSLSGFLLLLLPIAQRKKFPGQTGNLFKYSALAACSLVVALLMLTGVLMGMRTVQGGLAESTNPQVVLQDATFDAIDEELEDLAAFPGLILIPLQQVTTGEKEDLGSAVLENAAQFQEDFVMFKSIADNLKFMQSVMGYVPIILTILAVVLFFVTLKDMIKDVVKAPERAVKGEIKGTEVMAIVGRRVFNEILVTIGVLSVLFVITIFTGIALGFIAVPAMSIFFGQLTATLEYVFVQPGASKAIIYIALMGVLVFIVLAVALIIVSTTMYLGKVQAILRARLNNKVPMSTFTKSFFLWRTLAMLWCLAIPTFTMYGMSFLADYLTDKATEGTEYNWNLALLPAPLGLLGIFFLLLFAGYGLKAVLSIVKYKVPTQVIGDSALAQAAAALPTK